MSQGFTKDYLVKANGETDALVNGTKQNTTSGTAIDFTIPSGVKEVCLLLHDVSVSSTDALAVQLGTSAGIETTSGAYEGSVWTANTTNSLHSDSFRITAGSLGSYAYSGIVTLKLLDEATNTWSMAANVAYNDTASSSTASGSVQLVGELTTVRLTSSNGVVTFDQGLANVQYDNPDLAVSYNGTLPAGVTDVFINGTKQNSTAGTEIDFTVPAGVKRVAVTFQGVSTNGTSVPILQLGDSGGIETSGYISDAVAHSAAFEAYSTSTAGFVIKGNTANSQVTNGTYQLHLHDAASNAWSLVGQYMRSESSAGGYCNGIKSLSNELTTIRLTTVGGSNTFDAGSINVQYDNPELDLGSGVISGGAVQQVFTQDGEVATTTTTIPNDDTIPQNTEGAEFMTCSITPTKSTNRLRIDVVCHVSHSSAGSTSNMLGALFQDSTADAIAAGKSPKDLNATSDACITFTHWMTAGTTSSTTFKLRAGSGIAGTTTFNGQSGGRKFGGVMASSITITEYEV